MNQEQSNTRHERDHRQLESLFSHAKARPRPPADTEQRVRRAVEDEWTRMVGRRRNRRRRTGMAIAASAVLAVFLGSQWMKPAAPPSAVPVAFAERVTGMAHRMEGQHTETLQTMSPIQSGQTLVTSSDGRLGIAWEGGASIRLDVDTRVRVVSSSEFELLNGRVYVDIDPEVSGDLQLDMQTRQGMVRHLGTQYMAESAAGTLILSVREGAIEIDRPSYPAKGMLTSGEQWLLVDGAPTVRRDIERVDGRWRWTENVAPGFEMEGRSLSQFIAWAARQTGRKVQYADASAERAARETILHGEIDLPPSRALGMVLQTTDLEASEAGENIIVRQRD